MEPIVLSYRGISPKIADNCFIAPGSAVIGDVVLGAEASVWFGCVVRGDVCHVRIGERTNVQDATVIHVTREGIPTEIGAGVMIGHACLLHACTLEDRCFVGMGAVVMDRAVVETGAMVAAGSLVTPGKRVSAGQLWAGRPARYVREVTADEHTEWADQVEHYVDLANTYRTRL